MAQSSIRSTGLLSAGPSKAGAHDEDRSFARDLNLDQIVAAIAGDREERDLIRRVLFAPLHDADAVRYRQEVFQDLENPALFGEVESFSELIGEVRAHLRQSAKMQDRYQREGWLLDAAAIYRGAVRSLAGHLASAQISSPALLAFRDYLASYAASAEFTAPTADTRNRKEALGQIRYCTRIRGDRVEVSRYAGEADRQVVSALLDAGIKVTFVTHRFGFAQHFHRQQAGSTLFLRAERQPDGRRDYKLAVKDPLPTSFGEDLYYWLEEAKPCP